MTTIPWWAVPVLSGALTLLGVFSAQLVLIRNDRWKAKREDARRWHQDRLKLYLQLVEEFEGARDKIQLFATDGFESGELGLEMMGNLYGLVQNSKLISTKKVSEAAGLLFATPLSCIATMRRTLDAWLEVLDEDQRRMLIKSIKARENYSEELLEHFKEDFEKNADFMNKALVHFTDCVREELGVPGSVGVDRKVKDPLDEKTRELGKIFQISWDEKPSS